MVKIFVEGKGDQLFIDAFVDALPKSPEEKEKFKKGDFFFFNKSIWNLNSDRLKALIEFIDNNYEN